MSQLLAVPKLEQYRMNAKHGGLIMTTKTEELWQKLHDGLRAFIATRVTDQGHADDILQEVFVRVHRQMDSVSDPRRLVSWIYQVARNAIVDYYRKPGRQREVPAGLSAELEVLNEFPTISALPRHGGAAELRAELASCIRPMIERLSQNYRDAITLVEIEGLTQRAAAEQMSISLSGLKSRVQRGRKQIKQMLNDCCVVQLDRRKGVLQYRARRAEFDPCASAKNTPETDL
jgi:RNA polymerase sigma-70 factor (ECF subfamily)